eukprot:TRINITY_DN6388_c0_g1_i1.p1 TRINITY_DN6388_c0_g1~~TRINITY_DN6388_c0_g1_i1.p1  ORF type:complete len:216 (-),score=35.46 TRINITY_DN6388_c0_g1_i1:5-652(-)
MQKKSQPFDYYIIIDYEATCEKDSKTFKNEIIEFPGVLVDAKSMKIQDTFHTYIKPVEVPKLTNFCKELTGITQEKVNNGVTLDIALELFDAWLNKHNLTHSSKKPNNFAIVTDGPWDMRNFLDEECKRKNMKKAEYYEEWVNIRWLFAEFYGIRRCGVRKMLGKQGMTFEGNQHSGIDDAINISRIAVQMMKDGAVLDINDSLKKPIDGNKVYK